MSIEQFINDIDRKGGLLDLMFGNMAGYTGCEEIPTPSEDILKAHPRFATVWRDIMKSYEALCDSVSEYYYYVEDCQHDTERK